MKLFVSRFNRNVAVKQSVDEVRPVLFEHCPRLVNGGNADAEFPGDGVSGAAFAVIALAFWKRSDGVKKGGKVNGVEIYQLNYPAACSCCGSRPRSLSIFL